MRVFIIVLVLIFSFQSWTKADDIRDFEIEGISIGDSALDYFTKKQLNNAMEILNYKNNRYRYYFLNYSKSKTYEGIQITVKPEDKNFIIYGIDGHISYSKNIKDCYKKMDVVKKEVDEVLDFKGKKESSKHPTDKTGNSKYTRIFYQLSNGSAEIICYDMSKKMEKKGKIDRFAITLDTKELKEFLTYKAY